MKTIFITFDQAHNEAVRDALKSSLCRGYTLLPEVYGQGSKGGEPHLGSHAWPSTNNAIITVCDDERVEPLLKRLKDIDTENPLLGLRAFVWACEQTI